MRANEFIREHGLENVRSIISKYPNYTHSTNDARMFINEHDCNENIKKDLDTCVRFDDLKLIIESHELVEKCGGYEQVKLIIQAIPNSLKFYDESGYLMFNPIVERYFQFSNGVSYALLGSAFSVPMYGKSASRLKKDCIYIHDLKKAIADVESYQ